MRIAIPALLCVLLAGCQAPESQNTDASAAQAEHRSGEQGTTKPFFVGHWAASEEACETIAWEITEKRLSTPGEVTCDFEEVNRIADGYEIAATCFAEAPPASYQLKLSRAESADGLFIEGGPFNPMGLVACDEGT